MILVRIASTAVALALASCGPTTTDAPTASADGANAASVAERALPGPTSGPASTAAEKTPLPASTVAPAAPAPTIPAAAAPSLAVDAEGLRLFDRDSGAARPLPFGMPRDRLLAALAFRGSPGLGTQECPAGALAYAAWPDGLKLYFQKDRLAGWALDGRARGALATASGVGPGATRTGVEVSIVIKTQKTSLGTEFSSGGLYGLFEGPGAGARVSDLWSGVGCVFR